MSSAFQPRSAVSFLRLLVASMLVASGLLQADELRFKNGDRLTGEFVSQAAGQIRFRSALLGEISVPETEAMVVIGPETPVESLAGLPPANPDSPPPATAAADAVGPDPARWKGQLEFGFRQQSGSVDSVDFSLRADAERISGRDQYRASGRMLYGEKDDTRSSDRYDASFRWRRDFSNRIFSQTLTTFLSDQIKSIDESYEQNIGIGYRFLDRPRHIVNAGVGATGQYRNAVGAPEDVQLLGEFFEDYTYKINGRFTFLQNSLLQVSDADTGPDLDGRQNYKVQFDAALQGKITERLSLNVRFEHEFDNSVVEREARTDQRITSSLGYAF